MSDERAEVSTLRLYLMRGLFLLIFVGLGLDQWPSMIHHTRHWDLWEGVGRSLLAALVLMAGIGIRYPLQMLPFLLFELLWKAIWLLAVALPLQLAHQIDANTMETVVSCLMGIVICPLVIPWPYVWAKYVKQSGDRWGRVPPLSASAHTRSS